MKVKKDKTGRTTGVTLTRREQSLLRTIVVDVDWENGEIGELCRGLFNQLSSVPIQKCEPVSVDRDGLIQFHLMEGQ